MISCQFLYDVFMIWLCSNYIVLDEIKWLHVSMYVNKFMNSIYSAQISTIKLLPIKFSRQKLKKIIYQDKVSAINISLYLLQQMPWQLSAVTSGVSYISHRQRNYEINKAVNLHQSQGHLSSYKTAPRLRLAKNILICSIKIFFK